MFKNNLVPSDFKSLKFPLLCMIFHFPFPIIVTLPFIFIFLSLFWLKRAHTVWWFSFPACLVSYNIRYIVPFVISTKKMLINICTCIFIYLYLVTHTETLICSSGDFPHVFAAWGRIFILSSQGHVKPSAALSAAAFL